MTGECSRCGKCCSILALGSTRAMKPESKQYLLVHGCRIEHGEMLVPLVCPHLRETENLKSDFRDQDVAMGKTYCDIQDTKPQSCKDFDGRPISHGRKYFVPDGCTMALKWKR